MASHVGATLLLATLVSVSLVAVCANPTTANPMTSFQVESQGTPVVVNGTVQAIFSKDTFTFDYSPAVDTVLFQYSLSNELDTKVFTPSIYVDHQPSDILTTLHSFNGSVTKVEPRVDDISFRCKANGTSLVQVTIDTSPFDPVIFYFNKTCKVTGSAPDFIMATQALGDTVLPEEDILATDGALTQEGLTIRFIEDDHEEFIYMALDSDTSFENMFWQFRVTYPTDDVELSPLYVFFLPPFFFRHSPFQVSTVLLFFCSVCAFFCFFFGFPHVVIFSSGFLYAHRFLLAHFGSLASYNHITLSRILGSPKAYPLLNHETSGLSMKYVSYICLAAVYIHPFPVPRCSENALFHVSDLYPPSTHFRFSKYQVHLQGEEGCFVPHLCHYHSW